MTTKKRKRLVGYALYRKCNTYPEWDMDSFYTNTFHQDGKRRALYFKEQNEKYDWAKLINLKQKIKKVRITIEELNQLTTKKRGER